MQSSNQNKTHNIPDHFSSQTEDNDHQDCISLQRKQINACKKISKIPISKTLDFRADVCERRRRALEPQKPNRVVQTIEKLTQSLISGNKIK